MNTYFKIFPYIFLVLAVLFLYEGIAKVRAGENAIIMFLFTGALIFMFFFKRWQYRKITGSGKNK